MKFPSSVKFPRFYVFVLSLFVSVVILTTVLVWITPEKFPADNARYAYSAIFQGFAALLALSVTAVLITLQNMHSQKFQIREQIFKTLDDHFPAYVSDTISRLREDVENNSLLSLFVVGYESSRQLNFKEQKASEKRIVNGLNRKITFLENQEKHEKILHQIFIISVGLNVFILMYSLTALIIVAPEDYTHIDWLVQETDEVNTSEMVSYTFENGTIVYGQEAEDANASGINLQITAPVIKLVNANNPLGLNPFHILFVCAVLVLISLQIFAFFFIAIIKIWKLSPE